jgi:hypothetical protein
MAGSGSGNPPGAPLGITLPEWMKRKTPDRYEFVRGKENVTNREVLKE